MASSRGESEGWSTKARKASAEEPGAPKNLEPTGPLFDPLEGSFAPPAVPTDRPAPIPDKKPPPRTRPVPRAPEPFDHAEPFSEPEETIYAPPRRRTPPPRGSRRPRQVRRVKRTLRHIDPLTVFKVSLLYAGVFLLLWLLLVAILFWIIDGAGLFDNANELLKAFAFDEQTFEISLSLVEKWAFFIGLAMGIIMALFNTFLAIIYNIVADTIGGIDMTFVERD